MRRSPATPILLATLPLVLALAGRSETAPYVWTISASSIDPLENEVAATGAEETAWLWLYSVEPPLGLSAAQLGLAADGPEILSVVAWNSFLNAGSDTCLLIANEPPLLATGTSERNCAVGPVAALRITYVAHPGTICIGTCYGVIGSVDCDPEPQLWPVDWIGLGVGLAACESPLPVEAVSWGKVKGSYRE